MLSVIIMKPKNPDKVKKVVELLKAEKSTRDIQTLLKEEFGSGVNNDCIKEERDRLKYKITLIDNKITNKITGKAPSRINIWKPPKIIKKTVDLRDLKDSFVLYIKTLDPAKFTTPRNGTIKRIQNQNRYAFTHGTIDLLTQYLKVKKLKVIEE